MDRQNTPRLNYGGNLESPFCDELTGCDDREQAIAASPRIEKENPFAGGMGTEARTGPPPTPAEMEREETDLQSGDRISELEDELALRSDSGPSESEDGDEESTGEEFEEDVEFEDGDEEWEVEPDGGEAEGQVSDAAADADFEEESRRQRRRQKKANAAQEGGTSGGPAPLTVDLHCHSTQIPTNRRKASLWYHKPPASADPGERSSRKARNQRARKTFLFTQADFTTLAQGNARVVCAALYPLEQGFVEVPLLQGLLKPKDREFWSKTIVQLASHVSPQRTEEVRWFWHSYFNDLCKEYKTLTSEAQGRIPERIAGGTGLAADWKQRLVLNYADLMKVVDQEPHTIAVIPTIEGGHSLGCGSKFWRAAVSAETLYDQNLSVWKEALEAPVSLEKDKGEAWLRQCLKAATKNGRAKLLLQNVVANIAEIKKWGPAGKHAPFFVTVAHHFWNQLAGHAISFPTFVANQVAVDQKSGMLGGLTELGKIAIRHLLSRDNGRRILVDTKHMSLKCKAWYFAYVEKNNFGPGDEPHTAASWYARLGNPGPNKPGEKNWIPIVSSHSALSARAEMKAAEQVKNHTDADVVYNRSNSFNPWEINLSDEELVRIFESDGIVGLNLDERILSGYKLNRTMREESAKAWGDADLNKYIDTWTPAVIQQLVRGARVLLNHLKRKTLLAAGSAVSLDAGLLAKAGALEAEVPDASLDWEKQRRVWQVFAIGSDFDGFINPMDGVATARDFRFLRDSLVRLLTVRTQPGTLAPGADPILLGRSGEQIEEIVKGVMSANALRFLERYFTDEYLS